MYVTHLILIIIIIIIHRVVQRHQETLPLMQVSSSPHETDVKVCYLFVADLASTSIYASSLCGNTISILLQTLSATRFS